MQNDSNPPDQKFIDEVEGLLRRPLDAHERSLAISLQNDKSAEMVARELQGAVIADPKKIRPEHKDTADE